MPSGVEALAVWLASNGFTQLQWADGELESPFSVDRDQKSRWADWTSQAVAVARSARQLAAPEDGARAYLTGLLHGAPLWLASCGVPSSSPETAGDLPRCLPGWLADDLREVPRPPDDAVNESPMVRALQQLAAEDGSLQLHRDYAAGVRHRWTSASGAATRMLPHLMRRLRRLNQLETDFYTALQTEKLEALYAFAYGASHEINNPLANISTRAQTLLREEPDPERRRKLAVINSQAFRAHDLIADLMLFARPPELQIERVDATAVIDRAIAELAPDAAEQDTQLVRASPPEAVWVAADSGHLGAALNALCRNALEALTTGGRIEVSAEAAHGPFEAGSAPGFVAIRVRDTGPGLSATARRHLFDPYFSGREAGRGVGLGLSKCWRIVSQHGGRIEVDSPPGGGATFTMLLPAAAVSPATRDAPRRNDTADDGIRPGTGPARAAEAVRAAETRPAGAVRTT
jgi:signal transduction histidine kinase